MKILVTGANGFVGHAVLLRLNSLSDFTAIGSVRAAEIFADTGLPLATVGDLSAQTDWSGALAGVKAVVHTAARVHVMHEAATNPLEEFRRVNVQGTLNLAQQAAAAGVTRFVFISSIKVNGESTKPGQPFTPDDAPAPLDAYGVSKMEAEQGLLEIAQQTGMEVVIIRPPLVYGPGVKANFADMMRLLKSGFPLPLGAIHNRRSLVALDNLVDLLVTCLKHPAAANQTFLVSDGESLSTTELLRSMGQALGCPARLIPVPVRCLKLAAALAGKRAVAQRLCGSLHVDIEKTRRLLGWRPTVSLNEGLKRAGAMDSSGNNNHIAWSEANNGRKYLMKRLFDLLLAIIAVLVLCLPLLLVATLVRLTSAGPIIYWSDRMGRYNQIFKMPKFRSMRVGTPALATHLLADPRSVLTPIGSFIRTSSLDELPQLWSILVGEMSFVGPRPALFNQYDLIALRTERGVHTLVPGLTGWAQVNGRDEVLILQKVELDFYYLKHQDLWFDIKILWLTFLKVVKRDRVSH